MQKLIDGIVPFLIFCALVARFVNWIRTTFFMPNPALNSGRVEQPAVPRQRATHDPASFRSEMTSQSIPRPAATTAGSRPQRTQEPVRAQQSRPKKQRNAPTARPAAKPVGADRSPGSGVGAHVDAFIGKHVKSHIGNQLSESVKTDINDQVRSHLGEDKNRPTAPTAATTHGSAAAGDLLLALRSPQGVRQAILNSEVLSKPKAQRRS